MLKEGVSFVVPVYNTGETLSECVHSILEGDFEFPFEILLVDDGSTCNTTLELLKKYENTPHVSLYFKENGGASSARNYAYKKLKYPLIFNLDSDDILLSKNLKEAYTILLNNRNIDVIYSDFHYTGDFNHLQKSNEFDPIKLYFSGNYIPNNSLFRKKLIDELGGYNESLEVCEDYDFWVRASLKGFVFYYFQKPLFLYRKEYNSHSLSSTKTKLYPESKKKLRSKITGNDIDLEKLNNYFIHSSQNNKKMVIKLFIMVNFPYLYNFLKKKKIFKNDYIID